MPKRGGGSGRILPHERDVNDEAQILGHNLEIDEEVANDIIATQQASMTDKCRKEYRNRIKRVINHFRTNSNEYYKIGTRVLSPEEKSDRVFFSHTNDRDLIYEGLNIKQVLAYLAIKKKKRKRSDGTCVLGSVSDIKKYGDAIKWGALRAGQNLPTSYHQGMDTFIQAYKKEHKMLRRKDALLSKRLI